MGRFRKPPPRTEGDEALAEARGRRERTQRRAEEIEPLLARLEARRRDNYIAEAVEETLKRGREW